MNFLRAIKTSLFSLSLVSMMGCPPKRIIPTEIPTPVEEPTEVKAKPPKEVTLKLLILYTSLMESRSSWIMNYSPDNAYPKPEPYGTADVNEYIQLVMQDTNAALVENEIPLKMEVTAVKKLQLEEPPQWNAGTWQFLRDHSEGSEMSQIRAEFPQCKHPKPDANCADVIVLWFGFWGANPGAQVDCLRNGLVRVSLYAMMPWIVLHETAHLFGLKHEDGFGHCQLELPWQTVMAQRGTTQPCPYVKMFSNPYGTYLNLPLGDPQNPDTYNSRQKLIDALQKSLKDFPIMPATTYANEPCPEGKQVE